MRITRTSLVMATGFGLVASAAIVTAPTAAARPLIKGTSTPVTMTILDSGTRKVVTTKRVHAKLSFEAIRHGAAAGTSDAGRKSTFAVTLQKGNESHTWRFTLTGGSFTDNGDTGRGHITSGKTQLKPFGSVAVTFSALGAASTDKCASLATNVTHRLQLHGKLSLKTHTRWGNWTGKIKLFHGKLQSGRGEDYPQACIPNPPCQAGISWSAVKGPVSLQGMTVGTHGAMTATDTVKITVPKRARRIDQISLTTPAWQLSSNSPPTLPITAPGGRVTGSATMTGSKGQDYNPECSGTPAGLTQWTSKFTQGNNPLTFHEKIGGKITLPSSANQQLIVPGTPV